jgi:hypothetical protein
MVSTSANELIDASKMAQAGDLDGALKVLANGD